MSDYAGNAAVCIQIYYIISPQQTCPSNGKNNRGKFFMKKILMTAAALVAFPAASVLATQSNVGCGVCGFNDF